MQYVTHDGFTQISTMSVSCPGPVGSNGSSTSFLHTSDNFLDLVLWNGVPFNDERISNFFKELNGWWFSRIRLFSMSQTCSIGARSGERLGQDNVLTLLVCKRFMDRPAMCVRALSYWKKNWLLLRMNGTTTVALCIQCLSYHNQVGLSCIMHSSPHHQPPATKAVNWHNTSLCKAFTRPSPDTNATICKL